MNTDEMMSALDDLFHRLTYVPEIMRDKSIVFRKQSDDDADNKLFADALEEVRALKESYKNAMTELRKTCDEANSLALDVKQLKEASDLQNVQLAKAILAKDNAYSERDHLVAALSKCFPSWLGRHEGEWEDDWRWIVYINISIGQVSWHIHDSELPLFSHLQIGPEKWDGHTTEEKYQRMEDLDDRAGREVVNKSADELQAGGIWTGIHESDTLQYTTARAADDEKHICPLQLDTIERCIKLYSNPGETVLTPFMGIGSEAYQAIRFGRRAIGIELKESYFRIAAKNLADAELKYKSIDLFIYGEMQAKEE